METLSSSWRAFALGWLRLFAFLVNAQFSAGKIIDDLNIQRVGCFKRDTVAFNVK
jgi:hypothetical protein